MQRRTSLLASGLFLLCACSDELPTASSSFEPALDIDTAGSVSTDLGTLPGGSFSIAWAVNASSTIVGESGVAGGAVHAFRWTAAGGMQDLGTLGGAVSHAYGVNGAGVVVGSADTINLPEDSTDGGFHAFLWTQAGGMRSLGGELSQANDVNASNVVVGSVAVDGNRHAFSWTEATGMVDLGIIGVDGYESEAFAVNDAGVIVGVSSLGEGPKQAFRLVPGDTMTSLGALPGHTSSVARDVNNDGTIVGESGLGTSMRAFVWTEANGMQQLPSRADSIFAEVAFGINDDGEIVGRSRNDLNQFHAVLWTPNGDGTYTIHDIAGVGSFAYDLNGGGTVVGQSGATATRWSYAMTGVVPLAPASVDATVLSPTQVDLAWSDASPNETQFRIQRQLRNRSNTAWESWVLVANVPANDTTYSDTLSVSGFMRWRVGACNASGCAYRTSRRTYVGTIPGVATAVAAVDSADAIVITWDHPTDDATRFTISRGAFNAETHTFGPFVSIASAPGTSRRKVDGDVVAGTRYRYRVTACNPIGCAAYGLSAPVTAASPPAAPTGPVLSQPVAGTVELTWNDVASETRYEVQRRERDTVTLVWGPFQDAGTTGANVTTYSDTTVVAGTRYRYRVRACNAAGCSDWLTPSDFIQAN